MKGATSKSENITHPKGIYHPTTADGRFHFGLSERRTAADRYLKSKLGEYLSTREIHVLTGIKTRILNKWRKRGVPRSEKLKGRWYYSIRDLIVAIKSADIEDIKS